MASPRTTTEPGYDSRTGCYFKWLTVAGKRKYYRLGKDKKQAKERLLEILLKKERGELEGGSKSSVKINDDGSPDIAIKELAHRHLDWVETNLASGTYDNRKSYINQFIKYLEQQYPKMFWVSEITFLILDEYYTWAKKNRGITKNGGNQHMRHVKTFLKWGWERELCNIPRRLPAIRSSGDTRTEAMELDDLTKLLSNPDMPAEFKRMIVFQLKNILRPQETYPFRKEWLKGIGTDNSLIMINHHKTSDSSKVYRPRIVYLAEGTLEIVQTQMELHPESEFLFHDESNQPYRTAGVYRNKFQRWCKRSGIKKYCPYSLRHTASTYMEIPDPADRKFIMGHSNIETSLGYCSANSRRLRRIMEDTSRFFDKVVKDGQA